MIFSFMLSHCCLYDFLTDTVLLKWTNTSKCLVTNVYMSPQTINMTQFYLLSFILHIKKTRAADIIVPVSVTVWCSYRLLPGENVPVNSLPAFELQLHTGLSSQSHRLDLRLCECRVLLPLRGGQFMQLNLNHHINTLH